MSRWRSRRQQRDGLGEERREEEVTTTSIAAACVGADDSSHPGSRQAVAPVATSLLEAGEAGATVDTGSLQGRKLPAEGLTQLDDDPRRMQGAELGKAQQAAMGHAGNFRGRNTVSFDPASTLARPSMRIVVGPQQECYGRPVRHDDVVMVPNFFCEESDWDPYYKLIQEIRELQGGGEKNAEWVSWHEGAHLITKNPSQSSTYRQVVDRVCRYFSISPDSSSTRFNWYRTGADWKPFHHDAGAFNEERARSQNCTVGISFGSPRELAFRHARSGDLVYFPQSNGMLFYFGRDVNIRWQHGINALPAEERGGPGRVSIIVFGWCQAALEEAGSPPMLCADEPARRDAICRDFLLGVCHRGAECEFPHSAEEAKRWKAPSSQRSSGRIIK